MCLYVRLRIFRDSQYVQDCRISVLANRRADNWERGREYKEELLKMKTPLLTQKCSQEKGNSIKGQAAH